MTADCTHAADIGRQLADVDSFEWPARWRTPTDREHRILEQARTIAQRRLERDGYTNTDVNMLLSAEIGWRPIEHHVQLNFGSDLRLRGLDLLATGTPYSVHFWVPAKIGSAVRCNAASFVEAHNHPECRPFPSEADLHATKRAFQAAGVAGIALLDARIVHGSWTVSLRERMDPPDVWGCVNESGSDELTEVGTVPLRRGEADAYGRAIGVLDALATTGPAVELDEIATVFRHWLAGAGRTGLALLALSHDRRTRAAAFLEGVNGAADVASQTVRYLCAHDAYFGGACVVDPAATLGLGELGQISESLRKSAGHCRVSVVPFWSSGGGHPLCLA